MAQANLWNQFQIIIIAFGVLILAILAFIITLCERIAKINQKNNNITKSE
jgi:hypothetical protein